MGKREKQKEFQHNYILEVAGRLFAERGVQSTTMDDIAKVAECSKTTLYKHFQNKDHIYSHLVLENMQLLSRTIEDAIRDNDTLEGAYMAICMAHVDFRENYPMYYETMIGSVESEEDNEINRAILAVGDEINETIVAFLQVWMKAGRIRSDIDPLQASFALWSGICGMITIAYNKPSHIRCMNVSKQDFLEYGFRTFLDSILTDRQVAVG